MADTATTYTFQEVLEAIIPIIESEARKLERADLVYFDNSDMLIELREMLRQVKVGTVDETHYSSEELRWYGIHRLENGAYIIELNLDDVIEFEKQRLREECLEDEAKKLTDIQEQNAM